MKLCPQLLYLYPQLGLVGLRQNTSLSEDFYFRVQK